MYVCLHEFICTTCVQVPIETEKDVLEMTQCWEPNPGPLQEQRAPGTMESSLHLVSQLDSDFPKHIGIWRRVSKGPHIEGLVARLRHYWSMGVEPLGGGAWWEELSANVLLHEY